MKSSSCASANSLESTSTLGFQCEARYSASAGKGSDSTWCPWAVRNLVARSTKRSSMSQMSTRSDITHSFSAAPGNGEAICPDYSSAKTWRGLKL